MANGVYPLVCAACLQVVGVINAASFDAMIKSGDAYICSDCMDCGRDSLIEHVLEHQRPNTWERLTGAEIVRPGQLLVSDGHD